MSLLTLAVSARAQTGEPAPLVVDEERSFQLSFDADTLADLPLGENIYSLLETTQSELIADRFNAAGLNVGEAARVGGFLGSWSQTLFRVGDLDVTDPAGSGAALLFPQSLFWQRVDVATGMMAPSLNSAGLAVSLEPRRPGTSWTTMVQGSASGGSLASGTPNGIAVPIARLKDWGHASALVSGPLSDRLGLVAGGTWTRASKLVREVSTLDPSELTAGFANIVYAASPTSESRTIAWFQQARTPFEYQRILRQASRTRDTSAHVQSTYQRQTPNGLSWRISGGFTGRSRANELPGAPIVLDRLLDGPIPSLVAASADSTARRFALAARVSPARAPGSRHQTALGLDVERTTLESSDAFAGIIGEQVDALPARAWSFASPNSPSRRHGTTVAAFASDHIALSPTFNVDASARVEYVGGRADGAATGIQWFSVLPRAAFQWEFADRKRLSLVGGYRRTANRLMLDTLAFGDPSAPTGTVSRWSGTPLGAALDPAAVLIDRVGPGTGGTPDFSRIDGDLKRPSTDEFVIGVESHRRGWFNWSLMGIARREANLVGITDVGLSSASYAPLVVNDPGIPNNLIEPQTLTVYNRLPASYGLNRYLLTNPSVDPAESYALKMTLQGRTNRLFMLFGATAAAAMGSAGNRGFGPLENDQDALGELSSNPNAAPFARGRLFSDRAFTIKWTMVYRFPGDFTLGGIARYQDGQPFSRLVVVPTLNQGPEAVLAYNNGSHRFTFTGTFDLRAQKGFRVGRSRVDAVLDVFNLFTRGNEVEEYVVTGDAFRTPTAIEPTPTVHLGLRVGF